MYSRCGNDNSEAARLRLGIAVREAEASAHDTAIHHVPHSGFKHTAQCMLHNT
jgi:hypothetical protein